MTLAGNDAGRLAVVQSLAEFGSFSLERTEFRTVDKVVLDNRVYSDKPPLISIAGAAVYKPLSALLGICFSQQYALSIYLVNALVNFVISAGIFLLLFRYLARLGHLATIWCFIFALAPAAATWTGSFGATLNNHTPAALTALAALMFFGDARRKSNVYYWIASAFFAGLTSSFDIPSGVLLVGILSALLLWRDRTGLIYFVPAALAGLAVMPLVNLMAYGTVIPHYFASDGAGTFKLGEVLSRNNYPEYLFHILFGTRGIFSYHWLLLLAIPAACSRTGYFKERPEEAALALFPLAMVLFYGFFTNEYGGWAYGFRYLIPAIPPMIFLIALWFGSIRRHRKWWSILIVILLLQGVFTSAVGTYNPWCNTYENFRTPKGNVHDVVRNPFFGNLMAWSYENDPDGALTKYLMNHLYPRDYAVRYLYESYLNSKNLPMLQKLLVREGGASAKGVKK